VSSPSFYANINEYTDWTPTRGVATGLCLALQYSRIIGVSIYCLYRFGVLLALDNVTRSFWPNLPLADAYEQNVARHISM